MSWKSIKSSTNLGQGSIWEVTHPKSLFDCLKSTFVIYFPTLTNQSNNSLFF
jgi:hypothetical protein